MWHTHSNLCLFKYILSHCKVPWKSHYNVPMLVFFQSSLNGILKVSLRSDCLGQQVITLWIISWGFVWSRKRLWLIYESTIIARDRKRFNCLQRTITSCSSGPIKNMITIKNMLRKNSERDLFAILLSFSLDLNCWKLDPFNSHYQSLKVSPNFWLWDLSPSSFPFPCSIKGKKWKFN